MNNIPATDNEELKELLESIRSAYGYDFTEYAEASMRRRIRHFMSVNNFGSIRVLSKTILRDEDIFEQFVQEATVNVTEMFRDPSFYKSLHENVLQRLATYPFIKIWIAGCSTGEEVYSIAVFLKENGLLERSVLYATDINQKALQTAKDGIYHLKKMKTYTSNYMKAGGQRSFSDYYVSQYDAALLDRAIKQNIVFSVHNLAVDRSFNEFQLICCRNVLIYFKQQLQNKVIDLFYESLCPFGFLALGNKESLIFAESRKNFEEVDRKERIFIKTG
jgi:chemotaxis protein methyltransferase CheR